MLLPPSLRNEHLGKSNICFVGEGQSAKITNSLISENHTRDKLLSGSSTQKYFIETGARKIFHSVVATCPALLHLGSVISHQNYPQSISCAQRAATVETVVIKHIPRHFIQLRFLSASDIREPP